MNTSVDRISLDEFLAVAKQQKWKITLGLVAGAIVSLAIALLAPRYYVATTTVLPPLQQSGAANAISQLGALASVTGVQVKQPDELYVALLKSKTVQDRIIQKLDLKKIYNTSSPEEARATLTAFTSAGVDKKTGLISISVDDKTSSGAAKIANEYFEQLIVLTNGLAITEARQRRLFYAAQVEKAKADLLGAELAYREAQGRSGVLPTESMLESSIRSISRLREQIITKQVQLASLEKFQAPGNPEVQKVQSELTALRNLLSSIESGHGDEAVDARGMSSVALFRSIKTHSATLEAVTRQLELAKIEEGREGPMIQQIDIATPPERPEKPRRFLILVVGMIVTVAFLLLYTASKTFSRR